MGSQTIITIITSGVCAAFVTAIFNYINYRRNKDTDFLFDYRKYILQKRIAAFEMLGNKLNNDFFHNAVDFEKYKVEAGGITPCQRCIACINEVEQYGFWLTDKIVTELSNLEAMFKEIDKVQGPFEGGNKIEITGRTLQIIRSLKTIQVEYMVEVTKLNDIDGYLKDVKKRIIATNKIDSLIKETDEHHKKVAADIKQLEAKLAAMKKVAKEKGIEP